MRFSGRRLMTDIKYGLIQISRDRQSIFFAFIMPVLFLILGWFLFGVPTGIAYVDYLVPGILGISAMGPAIDLTIGVVAGQRASGLLQKIAITPLSRLEWNVSRAVTGMFVALFSALAMLVVAWLMFGYTPAISGVSLALVIAGSAMSVGMGMLVACLVKDREAASVASFTLTMPMILISGSVFPAEQLPGILRPIVAISPMTYLNDGLRSAMLTGNMANATADLAIVSMLAVVLFATCVTVLRSRDD